MARARIGELLVEAKVITQAQLEEALAMPRAEGMKMGQHLVEHGLVTEAQLTQTLSLQLSVPWVSLYHIDFSRQLLNLVPRAVAERFCAVPIFLRTEKKKPATLYVAMDDPTNEQALKEIATAAGLQVKPMIASPSDIRSAIRVYYAEGEEGSLAPGRDQADAVAPQVAPAAIPAPPPPPPPPPSPAASTAAPPAPAAAAPAPVASAAVPPGRATSNHALGAPPGPPVPPPPPAPRPPPPPPPPAARPPLATVVDSMEILATEPVPVHSPLPPPASPIPPSASAPKSSHGDSPDSDPDIEIGEYVPRPRQASGPRMVALTLLDGTTLNLPARQSQPPKRSGSSGSSPSLPAGVSEQLTARDLVSALRAASHGADASEILGETDWQALFAALLSLLLKKNLIADWEFVEELRNI